jgi:hypothetical protein
MNEGLHETTDASLNCSPFRHVAAEVCVLDSRRTHVDLRCIVLELTHLFPNQCRFIIAFWLLSI